MNTFSPRIKGITIQDAKDRYENKERRRRTTSQWINQPINQFDLILQQKKGEDITLPAESNLYENHSLEGVGNGNRMRNTPYKATEKK